VKVVVLPEREHAQKLIAAVFCVLLSVAIALYNVGSMDIRMLHISVLGVLLTLNAAYFFARRKRGSARWIVFGLLVGSSLGFYLANSVLFHYSVDPRLFLLTILVPFIVLNIGTVFIAKGIERMKRAGSQ